MQQNGEILSDETAAPRPAPLDRWNHPKFYVRTALIVLLAIMFAAAIFFFYPIMISWRLGQAQAFINMLFAFACLYWLSDRKTVSGALIGVTCLIKAQFSLFFILALLPGHKDFAFSQLAVIILASLPAELLKAETLSKAGSWNAR